ncbi:MAG: DUF3099 domain-containing protein [Umezawaea sp.]
MEGGGGVVSTSERDDTPVLITEAALSLDEQHRARKRKYAIMMSARIPCIVLAMVFIDIWWLAVAFLALSIPLPWMAVLIANDRPPRKSEKASRYQKEHKALEASGKDYRVIDG